jgi:hypothetical protein
LPRRQDPAKCYWLRLESLRWKVLPKWCWLHFKRACSYSVSRCSVPFEWMESKQRKQG